MELEEEMSNKMGSSRSDSTSGGDAGGNGRRRRRRRSKLWLFGWLKMKDSWRWRWRFMGSAFKWKRHALQLQLSFFEDVLFKIVSVLEAIVLVAHLCFFYLCCGCHI